jgi:hypothetical protein
MTIREAQLYFIDLSDEQWRFWRLSFLFIYLMSIPLIPYPCGVEVFFFLWIYTQTVGLLGRVIGRSQDLYLNTGQHKHRINARAHTPNIHALSGIRTHDHSVRASEHSSSATVTGLSFLKGGGGVGLRHRCAVFVCLHAPRFSF